MVFPSKIKLCRIIKTYGGDILASAGMQSEKLFVQHGMFSVYQHSVFVAVVCLAVVMIFRIKSDRRALVRGALLHDYFLYDWHSEKTVGGLHGFTHAKTACNNAKRDFDINENEQNMILTHVFPLNINPPKTREGVILCVADKICAIYETAHGLIAKFRPKGVLKNDD